MLVKVGTSRFFSGRFSVFFNTLLLYLGLSLLVRLILFSWSVNNIDFRPLAILYAFLTGFIFDLATGLLLLAPYAAYLMLFPKRWIGSVTDRAFTYFLLTLVLIIVYFSLLAEIPFWDEFGVRFNFIAVDYLIYTYEVFANINESYPLPLIICVIVGMAAFTIYFFYKRKIFAHCYAGKSPFIVRVKYALPAIALGTLLGMVMKNKMADYSNNLAMNEIGKNGVFSFFAAYRSNELDYATFYPQLDEKEAYTILKQHLKQENQVYSSASWDNITRETQSGTEEHPNIILIAIESFSGEFLAAFGNKDNLTPGYDSLVNQSIFFTNLYATGTRTVRGMEALTLCIPPTPGNSIVRRPGNDNLFSIGTILKEKHYQPYFIYGGDGYFDNMNNFFGGQGFDIVDRDRGNLLSENITTERYNIPSDEVSFENAWGICDENLYQQALKYADKEHSIHRPFFQFVMTTSNHKPYTFPEGKIDLPQGDRNAAVKYTDYALSRFIAAAKQKPWFANTVFVIVADHCANSAGKWEINIDKHHIPAIIYNLRQSPQKIDRLISQIDLMPTLFGYLGWSYNSDFYGKDINQVRPGNDRAFIGNYRTLGLLKNNIFTQVDDRKRAKQFSVSGNKKTMLEIKSKNNALVNETIAYYQTASERFKNGKMKSQ